MEGIIWYHISEASQLIVEIMILFLLYLVSLIWIVVFLTRVLKPLTPPKDFSQSKIRYIPLKKPGKPRSQYYVLDSGELVEIGQD
jgi:glycopeptide antibiotics resistance protein